MDDRHTEDRRPVPGTQTLSRGLRLLEHVGAGVTDLRGLSERMGAPRSTVARMLANLVAEGYLHHVPYQGYSLGTKLILLGQRAREQRPLTALARSQLEALARATCDTVHLGTLDAGEVLYLDKVAGSRGLEMRSRVGARMPIASTGLGKAMMIGLPEETWPDAHGRAVIFAAAPNRPDMRDYATLADDLRQSRARGFAVDLEENEFGIRCVAAPLRDATGAVVGAISVASAVTFLPEPRLHDLGPDVVRAANEISMVLGWTG
ncbi:IclR family transcriptional regulator [Falsirhodobacter halotolerans]|uniref:IclR family transcriptional regulator n=1 Tax=Falsirhodobacter halotolerans TaxID=1146892 RepID=UPI001FCFED4A|nr:IclR family transcriptional regulator [Falsirhodobacter halotolerans]MCJ8139246.1 IclR family transcriptional regulator [Falsirhodobacter halotolerans]